MNIEERNKKVEENLALVTFSLNKLGEKFNEDYFQQGVLELIRCIECFKEGRGIKFSTYAVKNITLKLKEYIVRDRVIKPKRTGEGGKVHGPICDSLDKVIYSAEGRDIYLEDTVTANDDPYAIPELMMDIQTLIDKEIISKRNYEIFKLVEAEEESPRSVAKEFNISPAEVLIVVDDTRNKLREYLSYNIY